MSRKERILQIASRMAELRAELAHLDAELTELVPDDEVGRAPPREARSKEDFLSARMLRLMGSQRDHSFDAPEIVRLLEIDQQKIDQVRTALSRLRKAGRIRRVREGKYRAAGDETDTRSAPTCATETVLEAG